MATRVRKKKTDRKTCGLYLSQQVVRDFKKVCKDMGPSPSKVVEGWMQDSVYTFANRKKL